MTPITSRGGFLRPIPVRIRAPYVAPSTQPNSRRCNAAPRPAASCRGRPRREARSQARPFQPNRASEHQAAATSFSCRCEPPSSSGIRWSTSQQSGPRVRLYSAYTWSRIGSVTWRCSLAQPGVQMSAAVTADSASPGVSFGLGNTACLGSYLNDGIWIGGADGEARAPGVNNGAKALELVAAGGTSCSRVAMSISD